MPETATMPLEIQPDVFFVGAFDPQIRTFDIIMKTANGSSYNAYVVKGKQGVAVLDTVKKEFQDQFFEKLEQVCSYSEIKYIIFNHLEPDHTGAMPELLKRAPQAEVIISTTGRLIFENITRGEVDYTVVHTGKSIDLGGKTLQFINTPYLHWPDTMSTYLPEHKLLFSGDVFGCHFYDSRMFDDRVGEFDYAFKYYYDHIMRPFKRYVNQALKQYEKLDIAMIAPLHGPIIRTHPEKYMELYRTWSSEGKFSKKEYGYKHVNIFYITSYGNTQKMAEAIYQGADSVDGIRASMYDLTSLDEGSMLTLLEESDTIAVGTPTINGDAVKPVWDLLSYMCYLESAGKMGCVFGSYGWSGEAFEMVHARMRGLKFRTPLDPLKFKLIPTKEELQQCFDYGKELAEFTNGKTVELEM